MFDFEALFLELSKVETCKLLSKEDKKKLPYKFSNRGTVIEVATELTFKDDLLEIVFYIDFTKDFPYEFPKIFINRDDYERIKYIPHINEEMIVCVFDEGQSLVMPKDDISGFILYMLAKAKRIIISSEDENSNRIEFKNEFKAYWEEKYSSSDIVFSGRGFHSVKQSILTEIKGLRFVNRYLSGFEYFIYDNDSDLKNILAFAKRKDVHTVEVGILVIENTFTLPPFEMSIFESIEIIKKDKDQYEKFKKLSAEYDFANILVIFNNITRNSDEYYGWTYQDVKMQPRKISGVRNGSSRLKYLKNPLISKKNRVTRLSFQDITFQRLQKRTTGYIESHLSIAVSGLGSIGSNLIFFLKNLPINRYCLIDNQALAVENINRHLLGFTYLKISKSEAVAQWLRNVNPLYDVESSLESVISMINVKPDFINRYDFHIVAIGSTMIEEFILKNIIEGKLTKPTIIFWVEPFLASGQMLVIMPDDASKALVIISNPKYKYAVLENADSQKEKTYVIEGSCQTGFFPYSSSYMFQFLSSVFPHLKRHLTNDNLDSAIYTWIGDKDLLKSKGLIITPFANEEESFSLLKNII